MVHNRGQGLVNNAWFQGGYKAMQKQHGGYTTILFSKARQMVTDILALGHQKHIFHGLVDVDVTKARQ
jgi:hypothetical protein